MGGFLHPFDLSDGDPVFGQPHRQPRLGPARAGWHPRRGLDETPTRPTRSPLMPTAVTATPEAGTPGPRPPRATTGPTSGGTGTRRSSRRGQQTVCVYGINVGPGTNTRIGCRSLSVSPDPFGYLDGVRRVPGGVEASGWSIDPDTGAPIAHIYGGNGNPGGGPGVATTANRSRLDVAAAHPYYGDRHGYSVFLATAPRPRPSSPERRRRRARAATSRRGPTPRPAGRRAAPPASDGPTESRNSTPLPT